MTVDVEDTPVLFRIKEECCGCSACFSICPQKAIIMLPDVEGFLYPHILTDKCIKCKCCIGVCPMKR